MKWLCIVFTGCALAQSAMTMKQLMLDLIHPSANDILLVINRGQVDDKDWATVRRAAATLVQSADVLITRGPRDQAEWTKDAKLLADSGAAAYKAAQAKDAKALAAVAESLDGSCTGCHKQYRPNVFPQGGSK